MPVTRQTSSRAFRVDQLRDVADALATDRRGGLRVGRGADAQHVRCAVGAVPLRVVQRWRDRVAQRRRGRARAGPPDASAGATMMARRLSIWRGATPPLGQLAPDERRRQAAQAARVLERARLPALISCEGRFVWTLDPT